MKEDNSELDNTLEQEAETFNKLSDQEQADQLLKQGLSVPTRLSKIPTIDLPKGYQRIRVQFELTYKGSNTTPIGDSRTEPDMHMSISQLLERHTSGPNEKDKKPLFITQSIPALNDLTDIEDYREILAERVKQVNTFIKEEKAQAKQAKKDKAEKEAKDPLPLDESEAEVKEENPLPTDGK